MDRRVWAASFSLDLWQFTAVFWCVSLQIVINQRYIIQVLLVKQHWHTWNLEIWVKGRFLDWKSAHSRPGERPQKMKIDPKHWKRGNSGLWIDILRTVLAQQILHSLKLAWPLKIGRAPKGKDHLPTIRFQGRTVSFRQGKSDGFFNVFTFCCLGQRFPLKSTTECTERTLWSSFRVIIKEGGNLSICLYM